MTTRSRTTLTLAALTLTGAIAPRVLAQSPVRWWPAHGTVILSGGGLTGATSDAFVEKIIALAGGPAAHVVVIPTANPHADTAALRRTFTVHGARDVIILDAPSSATANDPDFVRPLRTANAVFFTGGEPMRIERAYVGTLVEREIKAVLARGGVLAGDSAGAIALGCAWLTWLPEPFGKRGHELCALPRATVSPHANAARGYVTDDEVLGYLRKHRGLVGVDIDENTVVVVRGSDVEVFGAGKVAFLNAARSASAPWLKLRGGDRVNVDR